MGGTKFENLHKLARELWLWCMERRIWVFAEYVASKENPADEGSRLTNMDTEWELAPEFFAQIKDTPHGSVAYPGVRSAFRQSYIRRGVCEESTLQILEKANTVSTWKQYNSSLSFWWNFCNQESLDPYQADDLSILKALTKKFQEGASTSTLNTPRSAIALINTQDTTSSKILNRFFRASFHIRPSTGKYKTTWDVNTVLEEIKSWGLNSNLSLERLSLKLVMLLALGSAYRTQSISVIKIKDVIHSTRGVEIGISERIKTSRPGAVLPYAFFPFFGQETLCIATTVGVYMERTKELRKGKVNLVISFRSPHKSVKPCTVGRWLKVVMDMAGIDDSFTAHSTRHASTSKARASGMDIRTIHNAASWSENSRVFAKFYNRPLKEPEENFASVVLS